MMSNKSIYRCPICFQEVHTSAGTKVKCVKCDVPMKEITKGIICKK